MKKTILCFSIFLLFKTLSYASTTEDEISILKANYKKTLLFDGEQNLIDVLITLPYEEYFSDQMVVELLDRYPIQNSLIQEYIATIETDGSWADIDYQSQARSGWKPKIHSERILQLARAYANKEHDYFGSEEIENTIHKALKFWFEAKIVCPNWWYNQIGVPKTLGAAVILFEDKLTVEEKAGAREILSNSKFGMTGQNKVWLAGNVLVKALLENDIEMVKQAQEQIFAEIKIGKGKEEGIKTDWSFHQHGAQQQFGNYGAAFLATTGFWAKVFSNTSLAMEQSNLDLLHELIVQGYQRVLWKGYLDVNGLGRQFFKQGQKHKGLSVMFSSKILSSIDAKNKASYEQLINENIFDPLLSPRLTGLYHFWLSDQTVHRTGKWMTSLKMSSKRVIGAEGGNGDNKKGYYISDGALYTYIDGDEYYNIGAAWDWRKIPGTTVYQTGLPLNELKWLSNNNQSDFVGNVSQDNFGMTVMDLNRDRLNARKAWIFTPEYTFCMGTAISTDSVLEVVTTIEQNLFKDQLYYLHNKEGWSVVEDNAPLMPGGQRYYHNRTGYIVFGGDITAKVQEQTGLWFDVMSTYPEIASERETKKVVSIFQSHGMEPKNGEYRYIILPNKSQKEVRDFDKKNINVLKNEKDLQVVDLLKEKILFVAAYIPLDMTLRKGVKIKTSEACLLMIDDKKGGAITVSDPTHRLDTIAIELNGKSVKVDLPTGEHRGMSVAVTL